MALRNITGADCGEVNPFVQLATHALQDLTLRNDVCLPSTSQQYVVDNMMAPQTFSMDHLMREIKSQGALVPPVPANAGNVYLRADEFHNEIIQNSSEGNFNAIWSEVNAPQQFPVRPYPSQGIPGHLTYMIPQPQFATPHNSCNQPHYFYAEEAQEEAQEFERTKDILDELDRELENERLEEETRKQQETPKNVPDQRPNEQTTDSLRLDSMEDVIHDKYVKNNPTSEIFDPLQKGKELLVKGDLPGAILCFEAAVEQDETCVEAWMLLGTTWAENEQDPKAIYALKRGLTLEPHNLDILMALAISYSNDIYNYYEACSMLVAWLRNNPEYKDIVPDNFELKDDMTIYKEVQKMFIKAVQRRPVNYDYEVQCALGVLCDVICESDKEVDCHLAALQVRPHDSHLWNNLGAALANCHKYEEAIDAFQHALNIKPGFVRAHRNIGNSYMCQEAYKEAAEHFLIALNQQVRGQSNAISISYTSDIIWSDLRKCTFLMGRYELVAVVYDRNLEELNKEFGLTEFL